MAELKFLNKKVLITTNQWFLAPDGNSYQAVWGTFKGVHEDQKVFGFRVNRSHANWYLEIGDMVIAGCQVLYLIECPKKPQTEKHRHYETSVEHGLKTFDVPTRIYICKED